RLLCRAPAASRRHRRILACAALAVPARAVPALAVPARAALAAVGMVVGRLHGAHRTASHRRNQTTVRACRVVDRRPRREGLSDPAVWVVDMERIECIDVPSGGVDRGAGAVVGDTPEGNSRTNILAFAARPVQHGRQKVEQTFETGVATMTAMPSVTRGV